MWTAKKPGPSKKVEDLVDPFFYGKTWKEYVTEKRDGKNITDEQPTLYI